MSSVAPKGRQHLCAEALLRLVRSGFDHIPEQRCGAVAMAFTDAVLSAFARCALTSPALRAFDNERAEGHGGTLSGMARIPCATRRWASAMEEGQ